MALLLGLVLASAGCARLGAVAGREPAPEALSLPAIGPSSKPPARVVIVSVAGLTPDAYLPGSATSASMPTLTALAQAGVAAEQVVPVPPSSSYPAHATLATGRSPAVHGITADQLLGEHGGIARRPTPRPPLRSPALWEAVADSGRRAVVLGWPGSSGGRIDLVFPEAFPLEPGEDWKSWLAAHASPGLIDAAIRLGADAPATAAPGAERDHLLVGLACETLRSDSPPALLMVHLSQTEPPLLLSGPGSAEARAAFAAVDADLRRLLGCLRDEDFLESTALLVVGDHGVRAVESAASPNVVLLEKGLIVPTVDGRSAQRWYAFARSNGGSAFVYARTEKDARLARRALQRAALRTKAFRIVPASAMLDRGADPEAWFGIEAEEGYWLDEEVEGPIVKPVSIRGGWGHVLVGSAQGPGFVAWGRGVRSGISIASLRQVDVAPTAAVLLGFELGNLDGEPVAAALELPSVASPPGEGVVGGP
jgi:predicted AlkP superfamily pyrophosphatase or phosphodiesterase